MKLKFTIIIIILFQAFYSFSNTLKVFDDKECKETGIKFQRFNNGSVLYPRYDGKHFFIDLDGMRPSRELQNTYQQGGEIQKMIDDAERNASVISLDNINSFFDGSSNVSFETLPIVVKVGGGYSNLRSYIVISSIVFKTSGTEAEIAVVSESSFKNTRGEEEKIYLGSMVTLGKGGQIKGALKLISPSDISLLNFNNGISVNIESGTGICLGCDSRDGNKMKLVLAGSVDLNRNLAVAVKPDLTEYTGEQARVRMHFATIVRNWDDFYLSVSLPKTYGIKFQSLGDFSFWNTTDESIVMPPTDESSFCDFSSANFANITLDLSLTKSPTLPGIGNDWKGLAFTNFEVALPKGFREPNSREFTPLRLTIKHLFFDDNGISAEAGIGTKGGKIFKLGDGFDISLKEAELLVERNSLRGFYLGGGLRLPFQKKDDLSSFTFGLGFKSSEVLGKNVSTNELRFKLGRAGQTSVTDFNLLGSQISLCNIESDIIIKNWNFESIAVTLQGNVNFQSPMSDDGENEEVKDVKGVFSSGSNFAIDNFTITNKAPFVTALSFNVTNNTTCSGTTSSSSPSANQSSCSDELLSIAGFNFTLSRFSMVGKEETRSIEGTTAVSFNLGKSACEGDTPLIDNASATLRFKAVYEVDDDNERYFFRLQDISVSGIDVSANFGTFGFKGSARLFKNEPAFGAGIVSGFAGEARLSMKLLGGEADSEKATAGAGVSLMFLTVNPNKNNEYKAWAVDADVSFGENPGLPLGPVLLNAVFGGAYKGAIATNVGAKVTEKDRTGIQYTLSPGHWGFNFGVDMSFATRVKLSAMLAAEGNVSQGLTQIKGIGYAKFAIEGMDDKLSKISDKITSKLPEIKNVTSTVDINKSGAQVAQGNRATSVMVAGEAKKGNHIGAGVIITLKFKSDEAPGSFNMVMYPDINISIGDKNSGAQMTTTGHGVLNIANGDTYLHLGKQNRNERLGINLAINVSSAVKLEAFVASYFMLGSGIDVNLPPAIVPSRFEQRFNAISGKPDMKKTERYDTENFSTIQQGNGFATGLAVGVEVNFKAAKIINANIMAGAGFDALLVQLQCPDGWHAGDGQTKTWRGSGQLYGFAEGGISLFMVNIAKVGMGFLLKASLPKPIYAQGTFLVYAQIWKAKMSFNINGKIGDPGSGELHCIQGVEQPVVTENFNMIKGLSPIAPQKLSQAGNLYLDLEIPSDQTDLNTDALAASSFKLKVNAVFTPKGGGTSVAYESEYINPMEALDRGVRIPVNSVTQPLNLEVGKEYSVAIKSAIYPTQSINSPGHQWNNEEGREEVETYSNTYTAGTEPATIQVDASKWYRLEDSETFTVTIGEGFELSDRDVILYPAKDLSNVYTSDYDGLGYFKIDEAAVLAINSKCSGCIFTLGIFSSSAKVKELQLTQSNLSGYDFDISDLSSNTIYEIRIWYTSSGKTEVVYKKHYFKTDQHYNRFSEKIDDVNNNYEVNFSNDLNFKIEAVTGKDYDSFFSREEKLEMLSMKIKYHTWFNAFGIAYNQFTTPRPVTSEEGGYYLPLDLNDPKLVGFKINQTGFIEKGVFTKVYSTESNVNPIWIYGPFTPAIYYFYQHARQYNQDLTSSCYGTASGNEEVTCGCIPCFRDNEDYCILISNDLQKVNYYKNHHLSLPARFVKIDEEICFRNDQLINFNLSEMFVKNVTVTCTPGKYGYDPLNFKFELKSPDGESMLFPEGVKITHKSNLLTEREEVFEIHTSTSLTTFKSGISTNDGCPLNPEISITDGDVNLSAVKYNINYVIEEGELIKPCVTIREVSANNAFENCVKILANDPSLPLDEIETICGERYPQSFTNSYLVESWSTEESRGLFPEKVRGRNITVEIWDGVNVVGRATIEKGKSSVSFDFSNTAGKKLTVKVTPEADYICGDYYDPELDNPVSLAYSGFGTNKADACSQNSPKMMYHLSDKVELNKTVLFRNNDVQPYTIVEPGYYKVADNKVYFINNQGMIESDLSCSKFLVEFFCDRDIVKAKIYTDNTKTKEAEPGMFTTDYLSVSGRSFGNQNGSDRDSGKDGHRESGGINLNEVRNGIVSVNTGYGGFSCDYLPVTLQNHPDFEYISEGSQNCHTLPPKPTVSSTTIEASLGETINISASGCKANKYKWSHLTFSGTSSISTVASSNQKYRVQCDEGGCLSEAAEITVQVRNFRISTDDGKNYICGNATKTLSIEGCIGTFSWTSSLPETLNNTNTQSVEISGLSGTTTYTATCIVNIGKEIYNKSQSITIQVKDVPASVNISSSIGVSQGNDLCKGESAILSADRCTTAGSSIYWSHGVTISPVSVNPSVPTTYFAVCKSEFCSSDKSNEILLNVIEPTKPVISIANARKKRACKGQSILLQNNSCSSEEEVFWYKDLGSGSVPLSERGSNINYLITENPNVEIVFTSKCGKDLGKSGNSIWCFGASSNSEYVKVASDRKVTLTAGSRSNTASSTTICSYESVTLNARDCSDGVIEWKTPENPEWHERGSSQYVTSVAGFYKVRCNINNNCFNDEHTANNDVSHTVHVIQEPAKPTDLTLVNSTNNKLCEGTQIVLSASCETGESLRWKVNDNWLNTSQLLPTSSETYYAYCETSGNKTCITQESNAASIQSEYFAIPHKPEISASKSNTNADNISDVCAGDNVNISTSCSNGSPIWEVNNIIISGTNTTLSNQQESAKYRVRCKDWECHGEWSEAFYLNVHDAPPAPTVTSSHSNYVCEGSASVTLTAQGCSGTVIWSNGHQGSTLTTSSVQNHNYTAICKSIYGCDSPASGAVNVEIRTKPAAPALSNTGGGYCDGNTISLSADAGNAVVHWKNYNPDNKPTASTGSHTFTAYSSLNGCNSDEESIEITVNSYPAAPIVSQEKLCGKTKIEIETQDNESGWFTKSGQSGHLSNGSEVSLAGEYIPYISKNGCTTQGEGLNVQIELPMELPVINAGKTLLCNGETTSITPWRIESRGVGGVEHLYIDSNNEEQYADFSSVSATGSYFLRGTTLSKVCVSQSNSVNITAVSVPNPIVSEYERDCQIKLEVTNCSNGVVSWSEYLRYLQTEGSSINPIVRHPNHISYLVDCEISGCSSRSTGSSNMNVNTTPNWVKTGTSPNECYDIEEEQNLCSATPGDARVRYTNLKNTDDDWRFFAMSDDGCDTIQKNYNLCSTTGGQTRTISGRAPNWTHFPGETKTNDDGTKYSVIRDTNAACSGNNHEKKCIKIKIIKAPSTRGHIISYKDCNGLEITKDRGSLYNAILTIEEGSLSTGEDFEYEVIDF